MRKTGVPAMQLYHMHDPDVNSVLSLRYITKVLPRPRRNNAFVVMVFDLVMHLIHTGKQVILVGHSYGGCVVSLVAELLNELPQPVNDVYIIAKGSICIAPMRKTGNVNILYMYNNNDFALLAVRARRNDLTQKNIVWLGDHPNSHTYTDDMFVKLAKLNTIVSLSFVFREIIDGKDVLSWSDIHKLQVTFAKRPTPKTLPQPQSAFTHAPRAPAAASRASTRCRQSPRTARGTPHRSSRAAASC